MLGLTLDIPVLASVKLASLVLTLTALLAVFRFKVGVIPVLAACPAAGVPLLPAGVRPEACMHPRIARGA